jgi:hypothetical protein
MRWRAASGLVPAAVIGVLAAACGRSESSEKALRQGTLSYSFSVRASESPPYAQDSIRYDILVVDQKTRQPIQAGEGQIYANHPQGPRTWDGLVYGPEVGTYHGWLVYTMPGTWSVNIRFRRDSTAVLEHTDWMQDVLTAKPYVPANKR